MKVRHVVAEDLEEVEEEDFEGDVEMDFEGVVEMEGEEGEDVVVVVVDLVVVVEEAVVEPVITATKTDTLQENAPKEIAAVTAKGKTQKNVSPIL